MAGYLYRCTECGTFGKDFPIGTATAQAPCPACGTAAGRQYTSPMLTSGSSPALKRARDRADGSADSPAVLRREPSTVDRPTAPIRARPGFPALPAP